VVKWHYLSTYQGLFVDYRCVDVDCRYVVKSRYLSTYQGLLELEASLPDFVTRPRVKAPKPATVTKAGFTKRRYRQERELFDMHEVSCFPCR
jgi:hypothetical protein